MFLRDQQHKHNKHTVSVEGVHLSDQQLRQVEASSKIV